MKDYETLLLEESLGGITITFNREADKNSLNLQLIKDLQDVMDDCESNPEIKIVQLTGKGSFFCTGMDFKEVAQGIQAGEAVGGDNDDYMALLNRMATSKKIYISRVDGKVMAGGMGIVAASDLVFATPKSTFSLSEALWGLLPCCVAPYLIRRIGFQNAYRLTLTTETIDAPRAQEMNLVDELAEELDNPIRQLSLKMMRLESSTVENLKQYFRKMWIVTSEMEDIAVKEIKRLTGLDQVKENIFNFITQQKFPWEK